MTTEPRLRVEVHQDGIAVFYENPPRPSQMLLHHWWADWDFGGAQVEIDDRRGSA